MGINSTSIKLLFALGVFLKISSAACALDTDLDIKVIAAGPKWVNMSNEELQKGRGELMGVLRKFTDLDTVRARDLVEKLSILPADYNIKMDIAGKIYIFNRLYCNVPDKSEISNWKIFGGWGGVYVAKGRINSLFPLSKNKAGQLELTGHCSGYFGAPYRGLSEFDFLLERFGRRKFD